MKNSLEDPITVRIHMRSESVDPQVLRERLIALNCQGTDSFTLLSDEAPVFRSIEPAVLVALVGAGGTAIGALVTGLLAIAKEKAGRIVVSIGDTKIEMLEDTPVEKVQQIVDVIRQSHRVDVLLP
jgi:hypothetical protein